MRGIYFDCFSGISGDMCLAALIHAGVPAAELQRAISSLPFGPVEIGITPVTGSGIAALSVQVRFPEQKCHRHFGEVLSIIEAGELPARVKVWAKEVFWNLAVAEAAVHGINPDEVHFHEVGAVDSIVDIVGILWALDWLRVDRVFVSALPVGRGFVSCQHGNLPLPAPAVLELVKGKIPLYGLDMETELVTPTGAAIMATLAQFTSTWPAMTPERMGYGAGTRQTSTPNMLRVVVGDCPGDGRASDSIVVLETNIDDMNPEFYQHLSARLFEAGALDVFLTPIQMKKNRPGTRITILSPANALSALTNMLFAETTTLGVRFHQEQRFLAQRHELTVALPEGPVRVKYGSALASPTAATVSPELDDCERLARASSIPLKYIYDSAKREAYRLLFPEEGK